MVSVNLIFHLVSAITFVVLIWYMLRLQSQLAFVREFSSMLTQDRPKVKVDWPEAFLRRFAAAYGIRFESTAPASMAGTSPQKIDTRLWAELHHRLGLETIEWLGPSCRLGVRRRLELDSWRLRLEDSFQGKITIEWSTSSASLQGV